MTELITYSQCPSCASNAIYPVISAKDYTVTHEMFEIWHCDDCTLRFTQNIPDSSSISRYYQSADYVSHSDTVKGFINRLYHLVRNYTLIQKRKLVQKVSHQPSGSLLDVGAGTGAFVHTMKQAGWQITGLEPDETARMNASDKYDLVLEPPGNLFAMGEHTFDVVTMWHVLEHVHDLHAYLEQFHRIIRPGGRLIIALPNYTSRDAKVYRQYWAAYDVPRHLYHFSPKSMEQLGKSKGFILENTRPMWFDSFYVSMLSEKYRNESANLPGALWNGLISNFQTLRNKNFCSSVIYIFSKK